jgi:hypothetical protein
MTSDIEEHSDGHVPILVGLYIKLISRYLRLDPDSLLESAEGDGVAVASRPT